MYDATSFGHPAGGLGIIKLRFLEAPQDFYARLQVAGTRGADVDRLYRYIY
jgi:hypothetical protein